MDGQGGDYNEREAKPREQFVQKLTEGHAPVGALFPDTGKGDNLSKREFLV